jgi:hypothetical protein
MKNYTAIIMVDGIKEACVVRFESECIVLADIFNDAETEFMNELDMDYDGGDFTVVAVFEGHSHVHTNTPKGFHTVAPSKHRVYL